MPKKPVSVPAPEPVVQPEVQPEVQEAPAPEPVVPAADEPLAPPAPDLPLTEVEPLATYAARIEEAAQPLAVCQITHPDAVDGAIHVGKYAGIRLVRGDTPAALLSDGSTI